MSTLTLADAARMIDVAVRDKTYATVPVGAEVERFLRAKRIEGCRQNTIDTYEIVLSRLALRYAFFDTLEPFAERGAGPELILDFLEENWGDADPATLHHRRRILDSFFEWAYRVDRISQNPMVKLARPRKRQGGAERQRMPQAMLHRFISAQNSLRDQSALLLLGRMALRREDLRLLRVGEIDLARDELYLRYSKGGEEQVLPIGIHDVRSTLHLHLIDRQPAEFLLYPKTDKTVPLSPAGIDQWFNRCLERADIVGYTMHQLRHAAIDEARAQSGKLEVAQMLARHKNVATTQTYLHPTLDELRAALEGMV